MVHKVQFIAILGFFIVLVVACGGGEGRSAPKAEQGDTAAASEVQEVVIRPVGDEMKYETTEFTVKAGTKVRVIMDNIATLEAMQHNVVILKPGSDNQEVGMAALAAGEEKGYIPDNQAILFYTEIAKPGEKKSVEFTAPPAGDYPYICTFPGHFALMHGVMHSVE